MKILLIALILIISLGISPLYTAAVLGPQITGQSLILMERTTGTVLFSRNPDARIYPASTTKILTALVMAEHIGPDEIILIGPEIHAVPPGSSRAFLAENTYISGINLLRGIIVTSGNDTANVIAHEVAGRVSRNNYLTFEESEEIFAGLMNEKAIELGAVSSNFVNAHGFHHEQHFSTAGDMALIAQAALEVPLLAQIFAESYYQGPGVDPDIAEEGMTVSNYNWSTGNQLLLRDSEHFFPYATGMRTGFHNHARHALVSSAERDGFKLIAGAFQSGVDVRFTDSIAMFNYGFNTYGFTQIQRHGTVVDNIAFHNPMLGEAADMDVIAVGDFTDILPRRDFNRIFYNIVYDPRFLHTPTEEEIEAAREGELRPQLRLPIEEGEVIGQIFYTVNGVTVHTADIIATMTAFPRTMESDFEYHRARFIAYITSTDSAPVWIGVVLIFLLILRLIFKAIRKKRRRKMFDRKTDRRLHYRYRRY